MSTLEVATKFVEAFSAKDKAAVESLMTDDVVLDGPFPLGRKEGPKKAAGALMNVGKLGVKIETPELVEDAVVSQVKSPAGTMVLVFTATGDLVSQIDVRQA
jgi:ketosteroid isomerase-like protein